MNNGLMTTGGNGMIGSGIAPKPVSDIKPTLNDFIKPPKTITEDIAESQKYMNKDGTPKGVKGIIDNVIGTPFQQETRKIEAELKKEAEAKEELKKAEEKTEAELKHAEDREDAIRKETQEREDTQYQRLIEDMRRAGINPNLFMGTPASGGGITNASRKDLSREEWEKEVRENSKNRALTKLIQQIQIGFEGDQRDKDRALEAVKIVAGILSNTGIQGGIGETAKVAGNAYARTIPKL